MTATATKPRGSARNGSAPDPDWPKITDVPIDLVDVDDNVRADVGDLEDLAESIRQHGVMQPISVALSATEGRFTLVVGQRRLAAAKLAGLERIPAVFDPRGSVGTPTRSIRQLVENVQRRDLNPLEEAKALRGILDASKGMTQDELAKQVGRSRPAVTNLLRILDLHPKVQELVGSGQLSAAHAKALGSYSGKGQIELANAAVRDGWSAHETERQVQWQREQAERERLEVEKLGIWAQAAEKQLEELGADKKATTLTTIDGYVWNSERELKALKARGWKSHPASWSRGKGCDCSAYGVQRTYEGSARIVRRCVVEAHYKAKLQAEGKGQAQSWQERLAEDERQRAIQTSIHTAVAPQFVEAFQKLPANVARVLLWSVMDYSLNDWVKDHKGDRKKPDAWGALSDQTPEQLADELLRYVFRDFGHRYNVKLDWPAIAEAFGVEASEGKK